MTGDVMSRKLDVARQSPSLQGPRSPSSPGNGLCVRVTTKKPRMKRDLSMFGREKRDGSARFKERLLYLARRQYRIPADAAEDIVQAAMLTFLQVRERYPREEEHTRILVGIFKNKCREHINADVRRKRGMLVLRAALEAGDAARSPVARSAPSQDTGVLADLVNQEDGSIILRALGELRAPAREMFRLIIEEGATRTDLVRRLGLNKNTLDSRLHTYRRELRTVLEQLGVKI